MTPAGAVRRWSWPGGRSLSRFAEARVDIAEAMIESTKELAAKFVQHLPNVRIIEVLCVPVQEATLRRSCLHEMPKN
jgi:hypothetical protein